MTMNKRYQWYIDGVDIWDNQKEERIDDIPTLLNELSKENEQLKSENELLKQDLEHCANQFKEDGKNVLLGLK